jgi:ATP-dependent DNA helicase RecQ
MAGGGQLTREEVEQAHVRWRAYGDKPLTLHELEEVIGLGQGDVTRLVALLKEAGVVKATRGRLRLVHDFDPNSVPLEEEEQRRAYERSRLAMMRGYAEEDECRRRYLLNYFGEDTDSEQCAICDNDTLTETRRQKITDDEVVFTSPFALGERVTHATWGEGVVQRVAGAVLTVLFETVGYKTLALDVVQEMDLLRKLT